MQDARLYILQVLRNRMALKNQPMVEKALKLAMIYDITVEELIKEAQEIERPENRESTGDRASRK
jgi:transcriptional regulator with XRE-family HTH domain